MNTTNNFDTIGLIISLILSDNFTSSVESLAKACNLPVPQMRKYLGVIFENPKLLAHLSPAPEAGNENEETDNDTGDFLETARAFLSAIQSGSADNKPIYLIDMYDFIGDYLLLPITSVEAGYVNNIYPDLIKNQRTNLFEVKDIFDSVSNRILVMQDEIQNAIARKVKIKFRYKPPHEAPSDIICSPVSIIENLTEHLLYVNDTKNAYYRLDRITSTITTTKEASDIDQYSPNPYHKYFWGNASENHEKPVHVKLQIRANTANIIEKIKNDTVLRKETGKLYRLDEYYYYEDDILGMSDFRKWLRSYGSSITVLEPETLIDEIKNSSLKTLGYYDKLNSVMSFSHIM